MEESSFTSIAIDWLVSMLSQTEPASTEELNELRTKSRLLGVESDAGLRMKRLEKALGQCKYNPDDPVFSDPRTCEEMRVLLQKFIIVERRMSLGKLAVGVSRFKLYRGGEIAEYVKDGSD